MMSLGRKEMTLRIFFILKLYIVYSRLAEQLVSLVHLQAQRAEYLICLFRMLHYRILLLVAFACCSRHHRQIVPEQSAIGRELHHLRVYENEFQFGRMLGIQERCDYDIKPHGLALFCGSGHQKMRRVRQVEYLDLLHYCVADGYRKLRLAVAERIIIKH